MEKYVYKITNLINGKIYIGQTNNLDRRMQEHLHDKRKGHPIHLALKKYGKDNFTYEVLYHGENYNEEEKKWIKYYDTTNNEKGYNIAQGGQDSVGESNPMAKITQEQADYVIDLLLNTTLSKKEISKLTRLSIGYIDHINLGESWSKTKYAYPLRDFSDKLPLKQIEKIVSLLKDTSKTIDDIVNETNIARYTVLNINKGSIYKQENLEYPIRNVKMSKEVLNRIIYLLANTKMLYKDIAKETNTSISIVSNINNGKTWFNKDITYPIRNNSCRD